MSHVIILAGSIGEANAHSEAAGLTRGVGIFATSASRIMGVVPHAVHTLPGFAHRRDRHAILAAVKRSTPRYQRQVAFREFDDRSLVSDRALEVAYRYDRLRDLEPLRVWEVDAAGDVKPLIDPVIQAAADSFTVEDFLAEQKAEEAAAPEPAKARRRSRCKECGALHFSDEPCPVLPDADTFFGGA